jgi:hypothetical protein
MTPIPGTAYRHAGEPFAKDDCPGGCWCLTCLRERKLTEEIARLRGLIESAEWAAGVGNISDWVIRGACPWCDGTSPADPNFPGRGHTVACPAFPRKD